MEPYVDGMKRSLELLDTLMEGLAHIQQLLQEGKVEQTLPLFEDIVTALATIVETTQPILNKLETEIDTTTLFQSAEQIVDAYEAKHVLNVQAMFRFTFIPECEAFKARLRDRFQPYLVS